MKLPYSQEEWQKPANPYNAHSTPFAMFNLERPVQIVGLEFKDVVLTDRPSDGPFLLELRIGNLSVLGFASLRRLLSVRNVIESLGEWPIADAGIIVRVDMSGNFQGLIRMLTREVPREIGCMICSDRGMVDQCPGCGRRFRS